jgi:SAM-dependent methyltransferase
MGRLAPMADQTSPVEAQGAVPDPDYGASYYRNYWGGGGPYERNERWLAFFGDVAEAIVRDLHPSSTLDAGCAMGFLVEALHKRGVDAWGIDISDYAISQADDSVRERCSVATLTDALPRRYDLITCIEVVEHLPQAEAEQAIANLCSASDRILLSTTPQDFGEPTHLNVQPPENWSEIFARHGFYRDLDRDFSYLSPWAGLYRKMDEPPNETVRRYDRAWWRLRRETGEVRTSLLEAQNKISELQSGTGFEDRPELMNELDRRQEEILRLRDLLIGKDAELGSVRGRLAAAEENTKSVRGVASRVQARIPGGMRFGGAILRFLQGRRG